MAVEPRRIAEIVLAQNLPDRVVGIAEVDREGRFVWVNDARCRLTGHNRSELIGQHFGHVSDPEILKNDLNLFGRQSELDAYNTESKFRLWPRPNCEA